jgi:hypothetical protein
MKKFIIEYQGWHSFKEELGDDFVFFDGVVYTDENLQHSFPISLPFRMIEQQIVETIPSGDSIIMQIKKRIKAYGPQESAITKEWEECGIDLEIIFKKTVELKIDLEAESTRWNKLEVNTEELQKITDDLGDTVSEVKINNDQYYLLCSILEKVITNEIVSKFPVLLNSSSDNIIKLKEIIVGYIPDLAEELNDLIFEAGDDESR